MKQKKTLFAVGALLLLSISAGLAWQHLHRAVYDQEKTVTYSFTLTNSTNEVLTQAEFWTYLPVKQTATQRCCIRLQVSESYQVEADDLGNQVLHIKFASLAPFASKIIRVTATLQQTTTPQSGWFERTDDFLTPSHLIESDSPEIKRVAGELLKAHVMETAKQSYAWVAQHVIDHGYVRDERGALYALQQQQGDCTESAFLFTAFARANGIAARPVSGFYIENNGVLLASSFHEWSEFYEHGVWRIADPNKKRFDQDYLNYVTMHRVDNRENAVFNFTRFRHSGNGLEVVMN